MKLLSSLSEIVKSLFKLSEKCYIPSGCLHIVTFLQNVHSGFASLEVIRSAGGITRHVTDNAINI